jgi:collagen type III alpha
MVLLLIGVSLMIAAFAFLSPPEPSEPAVSVFPLPERYASNYGNDWGAARIQGEHEGTDIFAPAGTAIRSITAGTVSRAWGSSGDGWNNLGGYTVMIEASEDVGKIKRGDRLYYAHMYAPTNLESGETVEAGDKIGTVGDTGQGPPGTRGKFEPHLHLGWYEGWSFFGEDRTSEMNGAMNPYPMLKRMERRSKSPGGGKSGA